MVEMMAINLAHSWSSCSSSPSLAGLAGPRSEPPWRRSVVGNAPIIKPKEYHNICPRPPSPQILIPDWFKNSLSMIFLSRASLPSFSFLVNIITILDHVFYGHLKAHLLTAAVFRTTLLSLTLTATFLLVKPFYWSWEWKCYTACKKKRVQQTILSFAFISFNEPEHQALNLKTECWLWKDKTNKTSLSK